MTQQDKSRAAFEVALKEKGFNTGQAKDGTYISRDTGMAWEGWQAAIAHERKQRGEPVVTRFCTRQHYEIHGNKASWQYFEAFDPDEEWTEQARSNYVVQHLYAAPQPAEPVELDRYDAGLLGGQDGMPAYVWHDIIRAELDRAYDFYMDQLDRATPQPAEPEPPCDT